jgi:hypothetical protein
MVKHVTAEILGGLGNQLYLISASYVLGKRLNCPVVFQRSSEAWSICGKRDVYWNNLFKNNNIVDNVEVMNNIPNGQMIKNCAHFQNYRIHVDMFDEIKNHLINPMCVKQV